MASPTVLRLLVVRHGDRPFGPHDPELTDTGHEQARVTAQALACLPNVRAIYSSPFIRALQTAAPLAAELGRCQLIKVDWQLCEALCEAWVFGDPWPHLLYIVNGPGMLPHVNGELLDADYEPSGLAPAYPEFGEDCDPDSRAGCLERHRSALKSIAEAEKGEAGGEIPIVIVFGHGSTHNFLAEAACEEPNTLECVPNCAVTTLLLAADGRWTLEGPLGDSVANAQRRAVRTRSRRRHW